MLEAILSGVTIGGCVLIMFIIGIVQYRSKKPVSFYSGEKAPDEKDLSDVDAWNKKHGTIWIVYGFCLILAWVFGLIMGDNILVLIPFGICMVLPIPLMIMYHHHLIKEYYQRD